MRNYFVSGQWNVICDRCGLKHKSNGVRLEWTGLRVCKLCHENRHPQDLIRVPKEDIVPPWTRPEPTDVFISPGVPLSTESEDFISAEDGSLLLTES